MNHLIGVNFGNFLPLNINSAIYTVYDKIQTLMNTKQSSEINSEDIEEINQSCDNFSVEFLEGGKDTVFLVKMEVEDYKFMFKLYNLKCYEIYVYLLSLKLFKQLIPDKIVLEERGVSATVHLVPLDVYAIGEITSQNTSCYVVIQEFSDKQNYTDFIKNTQIPINIVKCVWKYIQKNGFVIDFLPSNFKIAYNQEHQLYWLEYLDYMFFNDPNLRNEASLIENKLKNEHASHEYFIPIKRETE